MDSSERIAYQYLSHQGFSDVAYEPDGNVPPDFLLNGRIAVEVRRLRKELDEPGDDPRAPYHREHEFAGCVERLLAHELGIDWNDYEDALDALYE